MPYVTESAVLCDEETCNDLREMAQGFLAVVADAAKSRVHFEEADKAAGEFRETCIAIISAVESYHAELLINMARTKGQKPDIGWLAAGINITHQFAFEEYVAPTEKSRSKFARKCSRKSLSVSHRPWKQFCQLFSTKFRNVRGATNLQPTRS